MNTTERYTRYALVFLITIAVLLLGASIVSANHGTLPPNETEPVIETTAAVEDTTEEATEEPETDEEITYEDGTEDFGYCEDVLEEDAEEPDTEVIEPSENQTEHECCCWINESELDDGLHVWECEECGATEFWEWFDEDEEESEEIESEFDEDGQIYETEN